MPLVFTQEDLLVIIVNSNKIKLRAQKSFFTPSCGRVILEHGIPFRIYQKNTSKAAVSLLLFSNIYLHVLRYFLYLVLLYVYVTLHLALAHPKRERAGKYESFSLHLLYFPVSRAATLVIPLNTLVAIGY